jgi:hypothetical protein
MHRYRDSIATEVLKQTAMSANGVRRDKAALSSG